MRIASSRCWSVAGILVASWVLAHGALAVTFSSSCERFEVDGNAYGSPGGALDLVDEFDDGNFAPTWSPLLGTNQETGGAGVFHNPGQPVPLGPTLFEISTIENTTDVEQGAGDFTATSYWTATLPLTDSEFHMQLYSLSPIVEAAGLAVNNFTAALAGQQGNGSLAGYSISQSLTHGFGGSFSTLQYDTVALNPASVTGRVVLRMSLDDATDLLTTSFSLDGGTTFQSPFPPIHVFNSGVTDYEMLLGAAGLNEITVPTPSMQELPLQLLLVRNGSSASARKVLYKARSRPHGPNFIDGDPTVIGASLRVQVNGGGEQCFYMPAAGWARNGRRWKYVDKSGTYGPVKLARLQQAGNGTIQNKVVADGQHGAINVVPPNPGSIANTNFWVPGGSQYCAWTQGATIRPNDSRTFRARDANAPPTCYVPACSPSGAFLDAGADAF